MRVLLEEESRCEEQVCKANCQMDARKVRLSWRWMFCYARLENEVVRGRVRKAQKKWSFIVLCRATVG
jgi:hypothetical protein